MGLYGTGLAPPSRGSDVPTGYPSMQDGSARSNSGEPALEFPEDGAVNPMSRGPPDNDGNRPAASQSSSCAGTRETTQVRSGRRRRCNRWRHESSISTSSRDSSPPIDEIPDSESGHATNQVESESYSLLNRNMGDTGSVPWQSQSNDPQDLVPRAPNGNRRDQRAQRQKETRAAIMVSCLNINGFSCTGSGDSIQNSKWSHINQLLRTSRTGILVISEAHLTEHRRDELEHLFSRRMKIHFTANPENPTGRGGVAIVINKQLTMWHHIETKIVVPGRAILLKTKWYGEEDIIVLGVYAPNVKQGDAKESAEFFKILYDFFINHREWWPDYMGGYMNFVEDAIDRLPMRADHVDVLTAFDNLKELLGLRDGWRNTYPDKKNFSFQCTRSIQIPGTNETVRNTYQSHIDRIYVTDKLFEHARQWKIRPVGIKGVDHEMVSVQIAHEDAPLVGKGRWACPDSILKDHQLAIRVKELGLKAEKEISVIKQSGRSQTSNPQRTYHKFITAAMDLARERERVVKSQARIQKSRLERAIDNTAKDSRLSEVEQSEKIAQLKSELRRIKQEDHATARCFIAAKDRLEGETVSKYYFQVNKESKPRDMIHALEIPEPPTPPETLDTSRNQAEAEPPLEPQQRYE